MNRKFTLACLLLFAGGLMAQRTAVAPRAYSFGKAEKPTKQHGSQGVAKDGATLWSEDFANGLAGNNGVGAWTTDGPDGALWLQDFDGPNGDFSDPSEVIVSTTAANGFMIFDSNLSNDGCTGGGTCVVRNGSLISPVLDLTANPYVHLKFEQKLRWCCSAEPGHFVDVSTDGGATWPYRAQVDDGINVNQDIGTHTKRVNLAPYILGNASQVRFRINHDGTTSGNMTHYHWQVDDISIVESPVNDLVLKEALYNEWIFVTATNYDSLEYGVYPYSQLRGLRIKGKVLNDGSADQPNTNLTVDINGPGGSYSQAVPAGTMLAAQLDSLYPTDITPYTPPAVAGVYDIDFTLASDSTDENNGDNADQRSFEVSEFEYGLDNGARDATGDNAGEAYKICNVYHIANDIDLTAVNLCVATGSDVGAVINAELLDINNDYIDETEEHTIASTEITGNNQHKWITLKFSSVQTLVAGEEYYVCLQHYGGTDQVVYAASGTSERTASLLYDTPTDTWFYTTETPMVRMNFDPTVGIEDIDRQDGVGLGQNFPNPANNGSTVIPYDLAQATTVTFALHDVSGKLVFSSNEGHKAAGAYRIQLSTENLNEGVYFYTLNAGDVQLTKRMTVIR